ncbi:MAG: S-layer homology domain-containing protein [Dysosmobacter welbionis]
MQALVLLVRFLGKEKEATSRVWEHPFTDVPSWASNYVGYAYEAGLTNGISTTHFGSGDAASSMYLSLSCTLGYSDKNRADFSAKTHFHLPHPSAYFNCVDTDIFCGRTWSLFPIRTGHKNEKLTMACRILVSSGVFKGVI